MIRSAEFSVQFGSNPARCRELEGTSQEAVAKRPNNARTTFTRMEHGERLPRTDFLIRLAGALNTTPAALLVGLTEAASASLTPPGGIRD